MELFKKECLFTCCLLILASCQHVTSAAKDSETNIGTDSYAESSIDSETVTVADSETDTASALLEETWVITEITVGGKRIDDYIVSDATDIDSNGGSSAVVSYNYLQLSESNVIACVYNLFANWSAYIADSDAIEVSDVGGFITPLGFSCGERWLPSISDSEQAYKYQNDIVKIFKSVTTYEVEDDTLYLFNDDKSNELQLQRKDAFLETLQ